MTFLILLLLMSENSNDGAWDEVACFCGVEVALGACYWASKTSALTILLLGPVP